MRSKVDIEAKRTQFEQELGQYPDSDEIQAIVDALNWVLEDSNTIDEYLSM